MLGADDFSDVNIVSPLPSRRLEEGETAPQSPSPPSSPEIPPGSIGDAVNAVVFEPDNTFDLGLDEPGGLGETGRFEDDEKISYEESQNSRGSGQIQISVCDPEKKGEGINAYTTYKIQTKKAGANGSPPTQSSVDRRYNDFVWLHAQFQNTVKGIIIPPLPEKDIMRRFSLEFIEQRRRGLETFLKRSIQHKHLREHEDLHVFLHGDIRKLDHAKQSAEQPSDQQGVLGGYLSWGWSQIGQTITNSFGVGPEYQKTEDDVKCDQATAYISNLYTSVSAVKTNATTLAEANKALAQSWYEFSESVTLLAQFENEQNEPGLGNILAKVGNAADQICVAYNHKADGERSCLQEPFHDYVRIVQAVQYMLKTRSNAHAEYQTDLSNLEALQQKLEDYNTTRGKEQKAIALQRDIAAAQKRVDESKKELQKITELVMSEIKRFKKEKNRDIKRIITHFVKLQIQYSKQVQQSWEDVLLMLEPGLKSQPRSHKKSRNRNRSKN